MKRLVSDKMAQQQIVISLEDQTSDRRFSNSSTSKMAVNSATKTKTEGAVSEPTATEAIVGVAKQQALSAAQSATGFNIDVQAIGSRLAGPAAAATIAITALQFAKYAFNRVNDISQRLNEYEDVRLRAGGADRGPVNQYGMRRNIFGRNVTSGTYFRR